MQACKFYGTVLYVDKVAAVVDFYRRAFGLEPKFCDEALEFAELETGGSTLAIAAHSLGEMVMPGYYSRPTDRPVGVEIAFLTSDVPASFDKSIAEGAAPIACQSECRGVLKLLMYVHPRARSLVSRSHHPLLANETGSLRLPQPIPRPYRRT